MENNKINKFEELYLKIFKVVILVVLTLTLVVSVIMLLKGTGEYFATPSSAPAAKSAPPPNVNIDNFINSLDPKKPEEPQQPVQQEEKPPVKDTRLDDMVDKYVGNLWTYFDGYQKSCSVPKQVTQDEFIKGFPKNIIKGWFQTWGENFAQSQDKFEKAVLSNPKVINYCKEKEGKGAVFFRSLDWHKDQYAKQAREGEAFEKQEAARVAQFEREENARVAMKKAEAFASLVIAMSSFGTFMMLALLLIFSKIESNLRGVKIIEKEVNND
ncbi:hypothetical protein G6713_02190 [Polynucleobacter paneuropaeus]|nr:hypothetical protein G6713_02190 [Polynucleobacter paneuropaeus]